MHAPSGWETGPIEISARRETAQGANVLRNGSGASASAGPGFSAAAFLRDAIASARSGDPGKARSLLLQASLLEPGNEKIWLWLAQLSPASTDRRHHLQKALRCNPGNRQAREGLEAILFEEGRALARSGAAEAARAQFEELVALNPRHESGWLWLASVAENRAAQRRSLNRVLALNPDHRQARALLQRPEFQKEARTAAWRCPICSFHEPVVPDVCPGCGLMLSLVVPERILNHSRLNRELVEAGVRRHRERLAAAPDYELHLSLGIALLNLRQVPEGLEQLRAASRLRPGDEILRSQIEILALWWARIEEERRSKAAVLLIDDSPTVHKMVRSFLEPQGLQVVFAQDGIEGLSRLKELRPALILLDITMPGLDGYQVCKVIKANPATAEIPVVMLTGRDGLIDKVRARMAGSTVFVTKPFTRESLEGVVGRLVGAAEKPGGLA